LEIQSEDIMKRLNQFLAIGSVALVLLCAGSKALGQPGAGGGGGAGFGGGGQGFGGGGGAGFDPTQFLQMAVDNMRDTLVVTNNDEWSIISPKLLKVMQLQMQERMVGMGAMARSFGAGGGGGMRRLTALAGATDPLEDELQQAIDNKVPTAQLKAAMAKLRASRKAKQDEKIKAQGELRDLLTIRQEAILLSQGLLD
jgi:hypothetical protein